jgi:hypothetical protein
VAIRSFIVRRAAPPFARSVEEPDRALAGQRKSLRYQGEKWTATTLSATFTVAKANCVGC